jgi:spermidine/putrescine transport system permease protein
MAERRFDIRSQPGFGLIALFTFFALYLPIATLVAYSFNANDSLSSWGGFSLRWFASALENGTAQEAALRSVIIALWAAGLATIAATMAMIPEIVTAVALLIVFSRIKVWTGYSGLGYLIMAHTAFCIPFAYLPIRARLESMDLTLERAAADLYATPWQAFRFVTFPLLRPAIIAGFMLAFVISLDDVVITEFVKSGGQDTLPTYMLGQIRRETTPEINAIATIFLAASTVLIVIFFFINRRKPQA